MEFKRYLIILSAIEFRRKIMKFMSCLNNFRFNSFFPVFRSSKLVSEYDQEIPQSQTADNPMEPRERAAQLHKTPDRQIKDIEILAMILVPLIMTLSRGHTGQIKGHT